MLTIMARHNQMFTKQMAGIAFEIFAKKNTATTALNEIEQIFVQTLCAMLDG
jgi:hypothetical protein